jgi:hypothetical protein
VPIGIDIRDKKLVFNGKIRIFQGVLGQKFWQDFEEQLIVDYTILF